MSNYENESTQELIALLEQAEYKAQEAQTQIQQLQGVNESLHATLEKYVREHAIMQGEIEDLKSAYRILQDDYERVTKENERLKEQNVELDKHNQKVFELCNSIKLRHEKLVDGLKDESIVSMIDVSPVKMFNESDKHPFIHKGFIDKLLTEETK